MVSLVIDKSLVKYQEIYYKFETFNISSLLTSILALYLRLSCVDTTRAGSPRPTPLGGGTTRRANFPRMEVY